MTDPDLEFLNENAQRRYPFVEDSTLAASGFTLSDGVILDLRAFHRERPEVTPQLTALVGGSSGGPGAVAGSYLLVFQMGRTAAPLSFNVLVPESTTQWPLVVMASVADPNYAGCRLGTLRAVIGKDILSISNATNKSFIGTAPIEPSLVSQLYRNQIDQLKVITQATTSYVGGDVKLHGGYNVDVQQEGQNIRLSGSPGGGELGRFIGNLYPGAQSQCIGGLFKINGIGPSSNLDFQLKGENGVSIVPLPLQNKIQIILNLPAIKQVCDTGT